ncbi:TetR family transcriptional regulator [Kineococcus siccus]|uniref:TetR family transcriptional regulator n=1 Tax=Kineococcus siccus TaxID=2696567 RepID=UPI00196A328B
MPSTTTPTHLLLLRTAERLYAERGLSDVSNRQVAEAAGQANNSAVAYHFGSKAQLVQAISRHHSAAMDQHAARMLEQAAGSPDLRDHVACVVRPYTDHLATLGTPSWCARFVAQVTTDPTFRDSAIWSAIGSAPTRDVLSAVWARVPRTPPRLAALRNQMMRVLIVHTCAEQEQEGADAGVAPDWTAVGDALVDAITAVLLTPPGSPAP